MTLDEFTEATRGRLPTAAEILALAGRRGWVVRLTPAGRASLAFPAGDALARAAARLLRREPLRSDLYAVLGAAAPAEAPRPPRLREWRWPDGMTQPERPDYCSAGNHDMHPGLAAWWRFQGDDEWQTIPGKEGTPPPPTETAPTVMVPADCEAGQPPQQARLFGPQPSPT